jgi:GTP-binding protein
MTYHFKEVKFIKSSPDLLSCPDAVQPEYAFVGRSNVGKSSLINYLAGIKKLAKTSGNPGLTRLINHFFVDETWYLVDLPGYGYAKLGKIERSKFDKLIKDYLSKRTTLVCLFQLIDCRHKPQKNDLEFLTWLGENDVPFVLCFTKTDKLTSVQLNKAVEFYKTTLLKQWETLPQIFLTSVTNNKGREEILKFIEETNKMLKTGSSFK